MFGILRNAINHFPLSTLLAVVFVALVPRVMGALDYGRDWYFPGSFTLINFDEGGSCRAALQGFDYSPLVGWQTLALAGARGVTPPIDAVGDARRAKAFCHSEAHLQIARLYSAATGAGTVAALGILTLLLFPAQPGMAVLAAGLLALSGWHISESLTGTVDAPSTFFIYSFMATALWAVRYGSWRWVPAVGLLLLAVGTKYWVFALFSAAVVVPRSLLAIIFADVSRARGLGLVLAYGALFALVTNPALPRAWEWGAPLLFYAIVPWTTLARPARLLLLAAPWLAPLAMQSELFVAFTSGGLQGRFGTDYGAIGWHKWLRNGLNLPWVLLVGLGIPGVICFAAGLRALWRQVPPERAWLVLAPVPVFGLYMLFLAPVTYYRHYLPLLPGACLIAALGFYQLTSTRLRPIALTALLGWQALLAWDLASDYHFDPRRQLPQWYAANAPGAVLASYYVNPPPAPGINPGLWRDAGTARSDALLRRANTLILSENWYDTAFANELNGPLVSDPRRLIKTTPEAVAFYRDALADRHPRLKKVAQLRAPTFMPELLLHRRYYGSFTQFVGDIVIFRVRP